MTRAVAAALSLLVWAAGCDPSVAPPDSAIDLGDAGPDAGSDDPLPPEPPRGGPAQAASPQPPVWVCPAGWRRSASERHDAAPCEPLVGALPLECPEGEVELPGGGGCAPLGRACPSGPFAEGLPAGAIFVDAATGAGGDGSAGAPFATIAEALAVAGDGDVVALARGTYDETVLLDAAVTLRGACPLETVIAPTEAGGAAAILHVRAEGARVSDLRVSGAAVSTHGIIAGLVDAASVDLDAVIVDDVGIAVAAARGGRLTGRDLLLRRAQDQAARAEGGDVELERVVATELGSLGLVANGGGRLDVRRAVLRGAPNNALRAERGGHLVAREVAIFESRIAVIGGGEGSLVELRDAVVRGSPERALDIEDGASLEVERVYAHGAGDLGVAVLGAGTRATIRDLWVEGCVGRGMSVQQAQAEVERVSIVDVGEIGAFVTGGATVTLRDLALRELHEHLDSGHGMQLIGGAQVTLERVEVAGAIGVGLVIAMPTTRVVARDFVIRGSRSSPMLQDGFGLVVQQQSALEVERLGLDDNRGVGALVTESSTLTGTDVTVTDTDAPAERDPTVVPQGRGIAVQEGGQLELTRVLVARNREVGVSGVSMDTRVDLTDVEIAEGRTRTTLGLGRALSCELGAFCRMERGRIRDNPEGGFFLQGEGTVGEIVDVEIRDIDGSPFDGRFGNGVVVQLGGHLSGERVRIRRAHEASLFVFGQGARAELTDVQVLDTLPRICFRDACAGGAAGVGVGAYLGGSVELTRFVVDGAYLVGIQLARDGTVDLHRGRVSHNPIGANPQTEGFRLSRLTDRVRYVDNGRNLDAVSLPVPEIAPMLGP